MLLRVALEALESLNEVLLLVVRQSLDDVDHEDAVATGAQEWTRAQEDPVARVVHDLWLCPVIHVVEQKDPFLEEHVHLVVVGVAVSSCLWLLNNVEGENIAEIRVADLVNLNRVLRLFIRQQVPVSVLELENENLARALDVDSSKHAIV